MSKHVHAWQYSVDDYGQQYGHCHCGEDEYLGTIDYTAENAKLKQQLQEAQAENKRLALLLKNLKKQKDYGYSLSPSQDLGHNASVCYWNQPYTTSAGYEFYCKEVLLDNKMFWCTLTAKEALHLLPWLQREEAELQRIVGEEEGEEELEKLRAFLAQVQGV